MILGIDPGLDGGLIVLGYDNEVIDKLVMPLIKPIKKKASKKLTTKKIKTKKKARREYDLEALNDFIFKYKEKIDFAVLEKVWARQGEGVSSSFTFGKGYGLLLGILSAYRIKFILTTPKTWQGKNITGEKDPKKRSLSKKLELYPEVDLRATERSKKQHPGLVDAILIANYGLTNKDSICKTLLK